MHDSCEDYACLVINFVNVAIHHHCFFHVAMRQVCATTQNRRSVVVQRTVICNYGQARYKLANALQGASGYSLTEEFKNAVRLLPSTYTVRNYMGFLDDWGTVSIF